MSGHTDHADYADHVNHTGDTERAPASLGDYDSDDLLTVTEAAGVLRVAESTVLREMNTARLAFVRIGRKRRFVRADDLRAYIRAQRVG